MKKKAHWTLDNPFCENKSIKYTMSTYIKSFKCDNKMLNKQIHFGDAKRKHKTINKKQRIMC